MGKWEMVKLGQVCDGQIKKISSKDNFNIDYVDISSIDSNTKKIISYQSTNVKKAPSRAKQILEKNDILVSTVRPNLNAIAINDIDSENIMVGSTGFCVLRCGREIDVNYAFNFCKSKVFVNRLNQLARGASYPAVNALDVRDSKIPLPPLATQKQIAQTLDTAVELLAMRKQQLTELDNLAKSIFYEIFGDPFLNEKGWDVKKLSSCCLVNPKKPAAENFSPNSQVSFIPMSSVSTCGDIYTGEIKNYDEVKAGYTYFSENDVLFAKITPCMENGKGAIARKLINGVGFGSTEFHVLRPIEGLSNSEWIYCLTALPAFRMIAEKNMSGSAGQKRVQTAFFGKINVPLPPITLQNQFATIITKIEQQKTLVKKALDETQQLFDSLMSHFFH